MANGRIRNHSCCFLNQTYIRISSSSLTIFHKSLPWPGGKVIEVGEIKQVFTKGKIHRGKKTAQATPMMYFFRIKIAPNINLSPAWINLNRHSTLSRKSKKLLGLEILKFAANFPVPGVNLKTRFL